MAQNESMEDILTSIRSGVEVAASGGNPGDILELEAEDIVEEAAAAANGNNNGHHAAAVAGNDEDALIDINAFASSGEEKEADTAAAGDVLGENDVVTDEVAPAEEAAPAKPEGADDAKRAAADAEFDKLLAELGTGEDEKAAPVEAVPVVEAPVAEIAVEEVAVEAVAMEEVAPVEEPVAEVAPEPSEPLDEPAPVAAAAKAVTPGEVLELAAIESTAGLQVAFPAEVLAAALRPMVKDWVAANLPGIVERLVKDEIGKLTQE